MAVGGGEEGGCVWRETANAGQMLNGAARLLRAGGAGCGVYKLIGFRLLRAAFGLPPPTII